MEIKEIPTPTMPDWLKLYNTYDPEYYAPGKRVSAEEWNTLFLASVRQGNYNADTLELLIKTYLPETYLTQVDFNQFSNEMRTAYSTFTNNIQEGFLEHKTQVQAQYDTFTTQVQEDFTALTSEVNSLEERVVKAEDVAYSLNDVIQEANGYAQAANQTAIEANTFAQEANDNASTALETANNAASTAASSNNTAQDALSTAQSAVTTANNAATQATQAVNTANAASLRAEDAIATANAAKTESAAAKNTAAQAETTANASNTTAESANDTASEAKRIAQNALDLVTEGQGSQVIVNGVAVDTFNADTKADLDYVDRQIAALVGAAPETLDTLEELAAAFKENADVVKTLEDAIVTKVAKTDVEDFLSATSTNPVQNKTLYDPVTFAESERQKSLNLFNINDVVFDNSTYGYIPIKNVDSLYTLSLQNDRGSDLENISFGVCKDPTSASSVSETGYFWLIDNGLKYLKISADITNRPYIFFYPKNQHTLDLVLARFDVMLNKGNTQLSYQPYHGQITHNGDAPVVFAEREKNRAINLFNYKTQAGTSDVTNNQDGSFTISNLTFYYPSLRLNIALKPNTKYTFAETVLEISDSVGLEASNVAFGVVAYYTDSTYSTTPEIPIRGTGRYSGTLTTNNKTIDYVEYRMLRKNNSTSILNGKVNDISVCEGDNTMYYPYEGSIVHEEQLSNYLPLSGGTMTGNIIIPYSSGLSTPDGDVLLVPYGTDGAPGDLYISEQTRRTIISGVRDRPQYNCPASGVTDIALLSDLNSYLPLAGGRMTGRISFADGNVALPETDDLQFITGIESYSAGGGMTYTHRDKLKQKLLQTNGAIIKGRVYNSGDDEGLIIEKADNGFAGLCLGSATGTRSVFYLKSDDSAIWRYNNGSSSYDISHPQKAGTIALTSDIPSGIITESTAYREFATLLPKNGTVINNGADLNSIEYLKVGNYYQSASANTSNMTNIPQKEAFMMTVYAPLSSTYDDESTNIWCYRTRCFMTLSGDRWWQFCYTSGTAGVWSYGPWHREIHGNGGEITGTLTISGSINLIV